MFNVVEQKPGEVVRYFCAHTLSETEMSGLLQTKALGYKTIQSVLYRMGSIDPISKTVETMVDGVVN